MIGIVADEHAQAHGSDLAFRVADLRDFPSAIRNGAYAKRRPALRLQTAILRPQGATASLSVLG